MGENAAMLEHHRDLSSTSASHAQVAGGLAHGRRVAAGSLPLANEVDEFALAISEVVVSHGVVSSGVVIARVEAGSGAVEGGADLDPHRGERLLPLNVQLEGVLTFAALLFLEGIKVENAFDRLAE